MQSQSKSRFLLRNRQVGSKIYMEVQRTLSSVPVTMAIQQVTPKLHGAIQSFIILSDSVDQEFRQGTALQLIYVT